MLRTRAALVALVFALAACDAAPPGPAGDDALAVEAGPTLTWSRAPLPDTEGDPVAVAAGPALYATGALVNAGVGTYDSRGFYTSTDDGQTWTRRSSIRVDPETVYDRVYWMRATDGPTLFAVARGRSTALVRSRDGGRTWSRVRDFGALGGGGNYWGTHFRYDGAVVAALFDEQDPCVIVFSPDAGDTWMCGVHPEPELNRGRPHLFVGAGPATVYAAYHRFQQPAERLHRSVDGGLTWEPAGVPPPEDGGVTVSRDGTTAVWGGGLFRTSLDDGASWTVLRPPARLLSVVAHARGDGFVVLGVGDDGHALYRVLDGGTRWIRAGAGGVGLRPIRDRRVLTPTLQQLDDGRVVVSVRPYAPDGEVRFLLVTSEPF